SFAVTGRDALPIEPGNWLASPLVGFAAGQGSMPSDQASLVTAAHVQDAPLLPLRRLPPSGARITLLTSDWAEGCGS
ncbi:MAG TPA: hypothetical protein VJV04_15650, partial [Nitrospiraceae bacterium]|nr:hypothetical protein [Nitrospiraceae bacterium]